jgi:hypothetical protein
MIRPSGGVGWREFVEMICPTGEAKYFCEGDWTGGITLIRFNKFAGTRTRLQPHEAFSVEPLSGRPRS